MHLLPLSLGRLADHAGRSGIFAIDGVLLQRNDDNTFEAVATDTKTLIRVTGPCVAPASDYPMFPELAEATDDYPWAIIPAIGWKRAFTWARKLTARKGVSNPACRSVAVCIGTQETTFGVSDGEHPWWEASPNIVGRYPPYADIIASALAKPISGMFAADALRMSHLLATAAEFADNPSDLRVEIESRGGNNPIVVRSQQPGGVEFLGLVMPLTPEPKLLTSLEVARMADLEQENATLRAECDELTRQVVLLKAALANLQ
jgi:hypothetical protein